MTLQRLYQQLKTRLKENGIDRPDFESRLILEELFGITAEDIFLDKTIPLNAEKLESVITQRLTGKPLSKIFGKKEFWGLEFKTSEDTLDPRPDSETLIEAVLKHRSDKSAAFSILDIGTGTGCLMVALLKEYLNAEGAALDISASALDIARENAAKHGVLDRMIFKQCSWNDINEQEKYDLVISNPPYIDPREDLPDAVRKFDPELALFADNKGLKAYEELAQIVPRILKPNGSAVFEIGMTQAVEVTEILEQSGFKIIRKYQDIGSRDRCLVAELTKKN